jgi:hypothetical protein
VSRGDRAAEPPRSLPLLRGGPPVSGGFYRAQWAEGGGAELPLGKREGGLAGRSAAEAGNNKQAEAAPERG